MAKQLPYHEGDWVCVPLDGGGCAVGLIARSAPKGRVLLGYFFARRFAKVPDLTELRALRAEDASLVRKFGDHGIYSGKWPVIGTTLHFDRTQWPMPIFSRVNVHSGEPMLVEYLDNDPNQEARTIPCGLESARGHPDDGLWGSRALEVMLSKLVVVASEKTQTNDVDADKVQPKRTHFLYFLTRMAADAAASALAAAYVVSVRRAADDINWLVLASPIDLAPKRTIEIEELKLLAHRTGGEYDGWDESVGDDGKQKKQSG